jgi:CelD/BcsL family acetyltransferase involved in cellulose biosynthesis
MPNLKPGERGKLTRPGDRAEELFRTDLETLEAVRPQWNRLAVLSGSPFLTYEWLACWWKAFGDGQLLSLLLRADDGSLRAGAWCRLAPNGELTAPTDPAYGYEWDVIAVDADARRAAWDAIARFPARRLRLTPVLGDGAGAGVGQERLERAGYRVLRTVSEAAPYVSLPDTWDDMLASVSRKLRSEWRSKRRALDEGGGLALRTAQSEADVERDFEEFLRLEGSGWKGRAGTALRCDPRAEALYRDFALEAARQGWLRLSILETDGVPVAAAYGCVFAGRAFRLKSGFDERYADRSPGLVLVGEELRRSIGEGLDAYEFLGAPAEYKLRWASQTRDLLTLQGYRGPAAGTSFVYRARIRPLLGRARRRILSASRGGGGALRALKAVLPRSPPAGGQDRR